MSYPKINLYQNYFKRIFDLLLSVFSLIFLWPVFILIGIAIKIDSPGPIIFKQKRVGKNGKVFTMYKFRTMVKNAESLKEKYRHLNEVDGPVFKIKNDPRFTKLGKFLSHTGLDELPQIINIFKEEMSFVGPRPLPINEESKIPVKIRTARRSTEPGLLSSWLLKGAHNLKFSQWMELDKQDRQKRGFFYDSKILFKTSCLMIKLILTKFYLV